MANTFEALMERATKKKDSKFEIKKFKSETLGIEISLHKPSLKKVTDIMDDIDETATTYEAVRSNAELVYEAWKEVQDRYKELKDAYGAVDPSDLIIRIFDENLSEINDIAQAVIDFYGLGATDDVKN